MYQVGHGSAEASEEIQASTVYLSTQTASDIYQTLQLSENHTHSSRIELFQDLSRRKSSKLILSSLLDVFSMQYLIANISEFL